MTEFMRPTVTTEEVNDTVARYIVEPLERGYGNTVVAFQRYPNGQPYAVYASPQENLPRVSPLAHFDSQMPLTSILPEEPKAAKAAANEMSM